MKKQKLTKKQKLESVRKYAFVLALTYLFGMIFSILNAIFREELNFIWWLISLVFLLAMLIAWGVGVIVGFFTEEV